MAIKSIQMDFAGSVGVNPRLGRMVTSDVFATITAAGYLNNQPNTAGVNFYPTDYLFVTYSNGSGGTYNGMFTLSVTTKGVITLVSAAVNNSAQIFNDTTALADSGTIRALTGAFNQTATTMTSGNVVGVRGSVNIASVSGGYVYGTEGKVIATGTLSSSEWTAGVFGQLDISAATINAGQIAPFWADYGTTSGTITSATGMYMYAGTNTTAATLFAMDYRYGKATNLLELNGSSSTYITTGGATPSGDLKKIAISIDGVTHYILAAAVWS